MDIKKIRNWLLNESDIKEKFSDNLQTPLDGIDVETIAYNLDEHMFLNNIGIVLAQKYDEYFLEASYYSPKLKKVILIDEAMSVSDLNDFLNQLESLEKERIELEEKLPQL